MASGSGIPPLPSFSEQCALIKQWYEWITVRQREEMLSMFAEHFHRRPGTLPPTLPDTAPSEGPAGDRFYTHLRVVIEWTWAWSRNQKTELLEMLRAIDPVAVENMYLKYPLLQSPEES